jgi:Carboxypeptidase regulatory-like domain
MMKSTANRVRRGPQVAHGTILTSSRNQELLDIYFSGGAGNAWSSHVLQAALAFTFLATSSSAMAQGVGVAAGTFSDPSASVLPGVTVALSNPGTIGGTQETVTDARGAYQFTRLVPGRYSVKATLTGFRSATQENVVVNADATARGRNHR